MSEVLSPGVAYGCFELLELIDSMPMPLDAARGLGKLGVVNSRSVVDCVTLLGWAEVNELGMLVPTVRGQAVRALPITESRLRRALLDMVEAINPPWVQNARFGRRRFLQYAPSEISQLCVEAGLASSADSESVVFWDTLSAHARGLHNIQLNAIGREGERLTLRYEEIRTQKTPRWIAVDSNEDGYDVLSQIASHDPRRLCIEVKASRQGVSGAFFLTRHEWKTAQSLLNFQMHLWDISSAAPKLAVIEVDAIAAHIPTNVGEGQWDTVYVPFSAFHATFTPVAILNSQQK